MGKKKAALHEMDTLARDPLDARGGEDVPLRVT